MQNDQKKIKRHKRFTNWYESTQNLPGRFMLEAVEYIFRQNCLARPEAGIEIPGIGVVDLKNIDCPVALLAGRKDHITPAGQMFAMEKLVSSQRIFKKLGPGGHIGTLMGTKSLADDWPDALDFMNKTTTLH
jgi:poly(3-hydroxyalkanoate) synthetase